MKALILLYGFLIIEILGGGVSAAYNFNVDELAKMRGFLLQESAEPGIKNYEQLGIESMDDDSWVSHSGLKWNVALPVVLLERVVWVNSKLSGHMDFSDFAGLKELWCSFNKIKTVNVHNALELTRFDFYSNDLMEFDVTTNFRLNYIRIGLNNVPSVDVSNNPLLKFFCCRSNQLEVLDVSGNESLAELYCGDNRLHTLLVDNCTGLKILSCDLNHHIESLNLKNLPSIDSVSCNGNRLKELLFNDCSSLLNLNCSDNELDSIDLSTLENLTELNCSKNELTSLNLEGCPNLTSLHCDHNLLYSLDITSNPLLSTLSCSQNNLTFFSLPPPTEILTAWTTYSYIPQNHITIECNYNDIDFSEFYYIKNHISTYTWSSLYSTAPITPLSSREGRFAFDESYIGKTLICRVLNDVFPGLQLRYYVTFSDDVRNEKPGDNKTAVR